MKHKDYLAHERSIAQFGVDSMKVVWAGSHHQLEMHDRIARLVASDPLSIRYFKRIIKQHSVGKSYLKTL